MARSVRASSPQVIEDACSFAWAKFMEHQPDRDRKWKGWLFRVAQRESWRLEREAGHHVPTRDTGYEPGTWVVVDPRDQYAIRDDIDDVLDAQVVHDVVPRDVGDGVGADGGHAAHSEPSTRPIGRPTRPRPRAALVVRPGERC